MNETRSRRKRRWVRLLQRYVLNPPMKVLSWAGLARGTVLLETRGHRTGRIRRHVVLLHGDGATRWIIAEHGTHASYVRNLQADSHVRIRIHRRWYDAHAQAVLDDDAEARLDSFGEPRHAAAIRRFGTDLTTIRIDLMDTSASSAEPAGKR